MKILFILIAIILGFFSGGIYYLLLRRLIISNSNLKIVLLAVTQLLPLILLYICTLIKIYIMIGYAAGFLTGLLGIAIYKFYKDGKEN